MTVRLTRRWTVASMVVVAGLFSAIACSGPRPVLTEAGRPVDPATTATASPPPTPLLVIAGDQPVGRDGATTSSAGAPAPPKASDMASNPPGSRAAGDTPTTPADVAAGDPATDPGRNTGSTSSTSTSIRRSSTATTATTPRTSTCARGCTVLIEGDSLTSSLARFLGERVPAGVEVIDSGFGGKRIDEMLVSARSDVDLHAGGQPDDLLFLWAGINDLRQRRHSKDPAENARLVHGMIGDYVAERRSKGWDWIAVLTMPRTTSEIEGWPELNRMLRTVDVGADLVIDIGADPVLADPFDPVHKNPDGLHLNGTGARHVADKHLLPAVMAQR